VLGLVAQKGVKKIINKIRIIPFINTCYNAIKNSKKLEKIKIKSAILLCLFLLFLFIIIIL